MSGILKARVCARCGKDQSQGESLVAATLAVAWAKDLGIKLKAPQSHYLDVRCFRKLQGTLTK